MSATRDVRIQFGDHTDIGAVIGGDGRVGTVIFAHGSGSSRHSRRNQHVASILQERGLQTVLIDLLTAEEEQVDIRTREHRFNIPLLAGRVVGAVDWWRSEHKQESIGLFGASTGAAAALMAATDRPEDVSAVVSRGGRPDLAGEALGKVRCPTLLIVGGRDTEVIALNQRAQRMLACENRLEIVPGASHLFEEPGTLDLVADLAGGWFLSHFGS